MNGSLDIKLADFGNVSYVPNRSPTLSEFNQENHSVSKHYIPTLPQLPGTPLSNFSSPYQAMTPIPQPMQSDSEILYDGIGRGTQAYTAPEIYCKDGAHSFPSDVYSLGVSLYVCTTGVNPFENVKNPVQMINAIQRGLIIVLMF